MHTVFWQMANHEVDRAVKQACSLCPPTQHFAQCVYQMAALYQGVADTGSTQSSVKQEYSRPLITGVLWHHCQAARSYRCHSALRHLKGTFTAFCVCVLMSELTRLSGDCYFLLVNWVRRKMCNNAYDTNSLQFCDMNHELLTFFFFFILVRVVKGALCSFGEEIQTHTDFF